MQIRARMVSYGPNDVEVKFQVIWTSPALVISIGLGQKFVVWSHFFLQKIGAELIEIACRMMEM
jgi:hypothetical protein